MFALFSCPVGWCHAKDMLELTSGDILASNTGFLQASMTKPEGSNISTRRPFASFCMGISTVQACKGSNSVASQRRMKDQVGRPL